MKERKLEMGDTNGAELQSKGGKVKFVLGATIPTHQYSNLQPQWEVYADTFEEAQSIAEAQLVPFWNKHVESGKQLKGAQGKKLKAFVGGEINYDDIAHVYTNDAGEVYLSGSQYAKQFEKEFNKEAIAGKMAEKWGVSAPDIVAMWELKSQVSMDFGTALHGALELFGKYRGLAAEIEKETHLHDHPILKDAVESFYASRMQEKAVYEALVVDHVKKRAGQIDRLLIIGGNKCRVQDYKTNADMSKDKLAYYWKQLSFYADILKAGGWEVEGLDIFHYNGGWTTYKSEVQECK